MGRATETSGTMFTLSAHVFCAQCRRQMARKRVRLENGVSGHAQTFASPAIPVKNVLNGTGGQFRSSRRTSQLVQVFQSPISKSLARSRDNKPEEARARNLQELEVVPPR